MNKEWSLKGIYDGIQDPSYEADFASLEQKIGILKELMEKAADLEPAEAAEQLLLTDEEIARLCCKLNLYLFLRQAADAGDGEVMAQSSRLMKISAAAAPVESAMKKFLAGLPDPEALAADSEVIRAYSFLLKENREEARHLLSNEVEEMVCSMNITGGDAWEKLHSYLTSNVKVDYAGSSVTLSEIRNLAYSPNQAVRRAAYEAEIASYAKIEDSLAFSLNNIKNQFLMLSRKRGYASPLEMTLMQSKMSRQTLEAMMEAVREYLPVFRNYLKIKAKMLGYENGLPWYELFAPMGKADREFTPEETEQYLTESFSSFTPEMSKLMKEAFEHAWIDFYPREGKEGGAFCDSAPGFRQSFILTNFDGTYSAVSTLAHELGHAFHNRQIEQERPLSYSYPMPVAETASTFNEIHLVREALKNAGRDEKLNLLETALSDHTQCIVDIYSRYLFETAVFEQCQERFLMAADLKELMKKAQQEAYGDGLDQKYMHPYMWACKSHYYGADLSFYNFPYAFGNLFAMGLYARFQEEGEAFVPKYKEMLKNTTRSSVEAAGALVGIDLTSVDFWRTSLKQISELADEFCSYYKG